MRKAFFALVASVIALSGVAFANAGVNNGTVLQGTLSADLSSATAHVGDPVEINGVHDADGMITGTLFGHITQVQKAGQGVHAQLNFVLDRLSTSGGATYAVSAVSQGITPPANGGKEASGALAGAVAGALIGKALGHSTAATIAGLVLGAGTGFLITSNNRQDIALEHGSVVKVLLKSVTRMQSSGP